MIKFKTRLNKVTFNLQVVSSIASWFLTALSRASSSLILLLSLLYWLISLPVVEAASRLGSGSSWLRSSGSYCLRGSRSWLQSSYSWLLSVISNMFNNDASKHGNNATNDLNCADNHSLSGITVGRNFPSIYTFI